MKLICSPTSPYARKIRILLKEKKLEKDVDVEMIDLAKDATMLRAVNPLGKLPVLITSEGEAIYDSPVICEFVDRLAGIAKAIPDERSAKWRVLTDQALADGLVDAAVNLMITGRFFEGGLPQAFIKRHMDVFHRVLNEMESRVDSFEEGFDLGQIAYVSALDYLAFRYPEFNWSEMRPNLTKWHAQISKRPSVVDTRPPE